MLYCNRIPKKKAGKIYENTTRSIRLRLIISKYISGSTIPRPKLAAHPRKGQQKVFLWTYERNGFINLNVKVSPAWRDFWRMPSHQSSPAGTRTRTTGIPSFSMAAYLMML